MIKSNLRMQDKVIIELIDRKTGRKEEIENKNNIWCEISNVVMTCLTSGCSVNAMNGIKLFGSSGLIKTLSITMSYGQDTTSNEYWIKAVAEDESTDSYTFTDLYLGYFPTSGAGYTVAHYYSSSGVTKPSDKILKLTWWVYITYDECA